MRKLVGVVVGVIFGIAAVVGLFELNLMLFPWPAADLMDPDSIGAALAAAPMSAKVMVTGSWFLGALVGGLIAVRAAGWATAGWIVTVLVALAGVYTGLEVPQPLWMHIAAGVAPFVAGLFVSGAS